MKPDTFSAVEDFTECSVEEFELIVLGGWIDKGLLNKPVMDFIERVENKKVAFFFTLGAYPTSTHAYDCINNIKAKLEENNNEIISHYHCQGPIDPKLIEWMKNLPEGHGHAVDQDRINRWEDAKNHPNEEDFNAARNFVSGIERKMRVNDGEK